MAAESLGRADRSADRKDLRFDAGAALLRRVVHADLSGVKFVFFPVFALRDVRHHDVRPALQSDDAPVRIQRFHRRRRGNVDIRQ